MQAVDSAEQKMNTLEIKRKVRWSTIYWPQWHSCEVIRQWASRYVYAKIIKVERKLNINNDALNTFYVQLYGIRAKIEVKSTFEVIRFLKFKFY